MASLQIDSYVPLVISAAILSVSFFVLLKNPRSAAHRSFFVFASGAGAWVAGIGLLSLTRDFFFDKVVNYGGLFFFLGFFLLALSFPTPIRLRSNPYILFAPVVVMALGIIPWDLINTGMIIRDDGTIAPVAGPLILPYVSLILAYVIAGIVLMIRRFKKARGAERLQISYLFLGTGIFMVASVLFDAILPAFGVTSLIMLGPLSALAFIATIAYAILRHELLDIRVVIQRGLIYSISLVFIVSTYLFATSVSGLFFDRGSDAAFFVTGILATLIGIAGVPIIERYFRKKTDHVFFKDGYDYAEALRSLSEILYTSTDLESIVSRAESSLAQILRASHVRIILPTDGPAEGASIRNGDGKRPFSLSIPIMLDDAKIGSITAGEKRSGDPYSSEDKKLLETFAYQAATALSRALLYAKVKRHAQDLEEKVSERTRELHRAHENERQMMTDISHGLQTPLAVLKLKLEQLGSKVPGDKTIESIERSIESLSSFVYDLLRLAQIERAEHFESETVDLSLLVEDIAEELDVIAQDAGVKITSSTQEDVCVKGEEKRIREAIMNAASNALKYMKPEGKKEVKISLKKEAGHAVISVSDTGVGISKEDLSRIFERFYRGESRSDSVRGSGLGLTIAKRIVEKHGGTIKAESEIGKGTTVTIKFPTASR